MKKLFIIIALLIGFFAFSQEKETEIRIYIPLRTYHFDRTPPIPYHSTEGGNVGAIGTYRRVNGKWFTDINAGVVRNSYNNLSILGQYGIGRRIGKLDVSLSLGIISGYKNLYEPYEKTVIQKFNIAGKGVVEVETTKMASNPVLREFPDFVKDLGILPAANLTVSYNTGVVSPLIVISPEYINAGITIRL